MRKLSPKVCMNLNFILSQGCNKFLSLTNRLLSTFKVRSLFANLDLINDFSAVFILYNFFVCSHCSVLVAHFVFSAYFHR